MNRVVVLGHSYLARLSIVRALGEHGYDITVLIVEKGKHHTKIDCTSKYVKKVLICPTFDGQTLVNVLLERCTDKDVKPILIPTSDVTVSMIDEYLDELKDYFLFPHINHEQGRIVHWMDKSVQKALARKIGIHVVDSWQIDIRTPKYSIPDDIIYPCFIKPKMTIHGAKSVFKCCRNVTELRDYIYEIRQKRDDVVLLVEKYLIIDKEYAVVGFSDGKSVYIPAVIHLEQVSQSHFGVARLGRVLPVAQFWSLVEQFKAFVNAIGYVGLFDIDFLECQGIYYFCELNLRFGGSGEAITKMGANLPIMLAEKLSTGQIRTSPSDIADEATFMNERVCLDDWYRGYLSMNDYKCIMARADFGFLQDKNDPKPYLAFLNCKRKLMLKRIVKRLLHRSLN